MVAFYGGQARAMIEEGAYPSTVDHAATNFGMRIGPLSMSDLVGLDLGSGAQKKNGEEGGGGVVCCVVGGVVCCGVLWSYSFLPGFFCFIYVKQLTIDF